MNGKMILISFGVLMFSGCNFNKKPSLAQTSSTCPTQEPQACPTQEPQVCPTQTPQTPQTCPAQTTSAQALLSKEDLKKYLIEKKITVEKIEDVPGANGIYEVNDKSGVFYIDQNKNVLFGMIVNLETGTNITLKKLATINNGHLLPFWSSNEQKPDAITTVVPKEKMLPSGAPPQLESPEDFDKMIKSMETNIESFKEQKKKLMVK